MFNPDSPSYIKKNPIHPINNWDTSNVTNMKQTFYNTNYNGDISNWDTSNVTDMSYIFGNGKFSSDVSNWDVSNVTNMNNMLYDNRTFNIDLTGWCVEKIKSKPTGFDKDAYLPVSKQPIWGACP